MALKKSFLNEQQLPLVIEPSDPTISFPEAIQLLEENRDSLKQDLLKYGGLLFRGFPITEVDDFAEVIDAMKTGDRLNYIGGDSPRDKVKKQVYTSTEAPPKLKIPLHNELSYTKNYPTHIYFYCDVEPQVGGETIIADARTIYKKVDPSITQKLENKKLKYVSRLYKRSVLIDMINRVARGHKTWMEVFETSEKEEVEKKCEQQDFLFKWHKNDWLEVNQIRPALLQHPRTGETVWFNQAHLYDFNPKLIGFWNYIGTKLVYCRDYTRSHDMYFADGTKVPRDDLYHIMDVLDENTIRFPWKKGDVMMLDNVLAMHGRAPFQGKRRILTALTRDPDLAMAV